MVKNLNLCYGFYFYSVLFYLFVKGCSFLCFMHLTALPLKTGPFAQRL